MTMLELLLNYFSEIEISLKQRVIKIVLFMDDTYYNSWFYLFFDLLIWFVKCLKMLVLGFIWCNNHFFFFLLICFASFCFLFWIFIGIPKKGFPKVKSRLSRYFLNWYITLLVKIFLPLGRRFLELYDDYFLMDFNRRLKEKKHQFYVATSNLYFTQMHRGGNFEDNNDGGTSEYRSFLLALLEDQMYVREYRRRLIALRKQNYNLFCLLIQQKQRDDYFKIRFYQQFHYLVTYSFIDEFIVNTNKLFPSETYNHFLYFLSQQNTRFFDQKTSQQLLEELGLETDYFLPDLSNFLALLHPENHDLIPRAKISTINWLYYPPHPRFEEKSKVSFMGNCTEPEPWFYVGEPYQPSDPERVKVIRPLNDSNEDEEEYEYIKPPVQIMIPYGYHDKLSYFLDTVNRPLFPYVRNFFRHLPDTEASVTESDRELPLILSYLMLKDFRRFSAKFQGLWGFDDCFVVQDNLLHYNIFIQFLNKNMALSDNTFLMHKFSEKTFQSLSLQYFNLLGKQNNYLFTARNCFFAFWEIAIVEEGVGYYFCDFDEVIDPEEEDGTDMMIDKIFDFIHLEQADSSDFLIESDFVPLDYYTKDEKGQRLDFQYPHVITLYRSFIREKDLSKAPMHIFNLDDKEIPLNNLIEFNLPIPGITRRPMSNYFFVWYSNEWSLFKAFEKAQEDAEKNRQFQPRLKKMKGKKIKKKSPFFEKRIVLYPYSPTSNELFPLSYYTEPVFPEKRNKFSPVIRLVSKIWSKENILLHLGRFWDKLGNNVIIGQSLEIFMRLFSFLQYWSLNFVNVIRIVLKQFLIFIDYFLLMNLIVLYVLHWCLGQLLNFLTIYKGNGIFTRRDKNSSLDQRKNEKKK